MTKRFRPPKDPDSSSVIEQHLSQAPASGPKSVESPGGHGSLLLGANPSAMIGPTLYRHQPAPTTTLPEDSVDGYLGPTSYAAIFRENKLGNPLDGTEQSQTLNRSFPEEFATPMALGRRSPCNLEAPEHVEHGAEVLKYFPTNSMCDMLLDRYFEVCDVLLPEYPTRSCHKSIWSTYGKTLNGCRDQASLMAMSQEMCRNAMAPMPTSSSTQDWMASFCGRQLRWELVGNCFALFGLAAMTLSDWAPIFSNHHSTPTINKRNYCGKMRECAEACLAFCNDIDTLNEWVIALMNNAYVLQSLHEGDTSQQLWRRHGGMASAVTAAGLHREADPVYSPKSGLQPSFLVAEFRRRLFCMFFAYDKQLATFMGRPPTLSRRYITCKLPLDLSEEEMMCTGEELDAILGRLDPNGWNTRGIISPNTICRAWLNVMIIRDEILELALGPPDESTPTRRNELKRKSREKYAQMPEILQYKANDPKLQTISASSFNLKIGMYQEWLLNDFLLDRLPNCGSVQTKQNLINTARRMLDSVLVLCANRDRLKDYLVGFVCAITYSGIPSAAILSIELLKQSKFPTELHFDLPRSEVIQNLSVFIGCLEWVRSSEGNYILCVRMRKVIKRILDQVLELPPPSVSPVEMTDPIVAPPEVPISSMFEPGDEPDFLEWLNSVDWTRDMLQDAWT